MRRLFILALSAVLMACAPAPPPVVEQPKPDLTREAWYAQTAAQLAAMNRETAGLLTRGKLDEAAAIITKGQALENRLLAVRQPTVGAMEAASDLDDLYGRMLLRNRNYGWARIVFQKNVARWKNWEPQTPATARRLSIALSAVAECDRRLAE